MIARNLAVIAILAAGAALFVTPASALSMKECSAKYKAAQSAGTLNGQKWNDFRKSECGAEASAAPAATTTPAAAAKPAVAKPAAPAVAKSAAAPAAAGNAVFPNAVSPKYSKETEGKARMHTCLDQYNANKSGNGNGGLKWIQKGGGYYSECNKHLKG